MTTEHEKTLALLEDGRRWFERENSTVEDWSNFFERDSSGEICRKCIVGGIGIGSEDQLVNSAVAYARTYALSFLACARREVVGPRSIGEYHSLAEVREIYSRAIELAKAAQ